MPEEKPEKEMEELSRAIVAAITNSSKVRLAMEKIWERDKIGASSYMMMMLELKNLAEYLGLPDDANHSFDETTEDNESTLTHPGDDDSEEDEKRVAEPETLTKNELAFREFLTERFDEADWLSKNRISFER